MKPAALLIGLAALAGLGGVAYAASAKPKKTSGSAGGSSTTGEQTDAERALDAIRTVNPDTCEHVGIYVASRSPAIAAALARIAILIRDVAPLPIDVRTPIYYSLGIADAVAIQKVADSAALKASYAQLSTDLTGVAQLVTWLHAGAPQAVDPLPSVESAKQTGWTPELASAVAKVLATQDPTQIRVMVAQLRSAGFSEQADALAAVALRLEQTAQSSVSQAAAAQAAAAQAAAAQAAAAQAAAAQAAAAQAASTIPSLVTPAVVTPAVVTPAVVTPAVDPLQSRKLLAGRVAVAYRTATRKRVGGVLGPVQPASAVELAREFQEAESLSRTDGAYGSETALCLAERYGIAPPPPLYWGAKGGNWATYINDKKQYNQRIKAIIAADPVRAEEFKASLVKEQ